MMRGRIVVMLGGVTFAAAGIIGLACGFPEISVSAPPEGGGGSVDAQTDALPVSDAKSVTDAEIGSIGDAGKLGADADCLNVNQCDCDNDGYKSKLDGCGGDDCDDRHPGIHPNQKYIDDPPEAPSNGDWDCSGKVDKLWKPINCGLLGSDQGFLTDVDCGVEADFYNCGALGPTKANEKLVQACK